MGDSNMVPLTELNEAQARAQFSASDVAAAIQLIAEGVVSARDMPVLLERVRSAAIRMSRGNMRDLREAVALAQLDWRDLLMAADFADDLEAHLRWMP